MNCKKRIKLCVSASLTALFLAQQTMFLSVMGSEITGVLPNGNTFNIDPTAHITGSDIGYRKYIDFQLDNGDIANLIFKYGDKNINTFVNLVDNQIRIDGIVNSMRNGNFYNGKAVFVSPNGMIVGASGVLNVGSLGVYTPTNSDYLDYKKNPRADLSVLKSSNSNSSVVINGKVIATKDIDIHTGSIDIPGQMLAGTGNNAVITGRQRAEEIFNSIVNTTNVKPATNLSSSNGYITLSSSVGTTISGNVKNTGYGNTRITNTGNNGVVISGNVANLNGNTIIQNEAGGVKVSGNLSNYNGRMSIINNGSEGINITKTGKIESQLDNEYSLAIKNTGKNGININGIVDNSGDATVVNEATGTNGININGTVNNRNGIIEMTNNGSNGFNINNTGKIDSQGVRLYNTGTNGLNIDGSVVNQGYALVYNKEGGTKGLNINGSVSNSGYTYVINDGKDGLNIDGTINTRNDKIDIVNNGYNGLNLNKSGIINSEGLSMYNTGNNGFNVNGTITNKGEALLTNAETGVKGFNIGGNFTNNGNTLLKNYANDGLNIAGNVVNKNGQLEIDNYGKNGLNLTKTGTIESQGLSMYNTGDGGLNVNGNIKNTGNAMLTNAQTGTNGLNINGTVINNGGMNIVNRGQNGLNINNAVENTNGRLNITNEGEKGLNVAKNAHVYSYNLKDNSLVMTNTGANGLNIDGSVVSQGNVLVYNKEGGVNGLNINGSFANDGYTYIINNGKSGFNLNGSINTKNDKLDIINNGYNGLNINKTGAINSEGLSMYNTGNNGFNVNGTITNKGEALLTNDETGVKGLNINGTFSNTGDAVLKNDGKDGLNITGVIVNKNGQLDIDNYGEGGLNLAKTGIIDSQGLNMYNTGENGFNIDGNIKNVGNAMLTNAVTGTKGLNINGKVVNNGDMNIINRGQNGLNINSSVENNNGRLNITNNGEKGLNIAKNAYVYSSNPNDNALVMTNTGANGLNINGNVVSNGNSMVRNTEDGTNGLNINGTVETINGEAKYVNNGNAGLNVNGEAKATGTGNLYMTNMGEKGINIASTGKVNSQKNITMYNNAKGGIQVKGLVNANDNIRITDLNGDVVIGDKTSNDNYITAGKNIAFDVNNGSILNYGVEKTLLNAGGDLSMKVVNGTIGLPVQQTACEGSGCTGIGPKADGARDFTKSINGKIAGKVNASTTNTKNAVKPEDLVINYAAIDSDMNIDTIKADGRVILTVDDSGHAFNGKANGTRYIMVNVRPDDNSDTNVEGWGISLIANGSIGDKENALTFIQNKAKDGYSMDALANENIYLKENSYNDSDYGRDKEISQNKVCTMIAREGDLDVEFGGNTTIENITAEGDMTVVTRGKTLEIENLGHIKDESVIPNDYFGPRDYGQKDGGYMGEDYRDEALPNHATVKALDINHNIRPTEELVDNGHEAWAGSTVKVKNAVLDQGTLDITADEIYANGIHVDFGKNGYVKEADNSTNKVIGSSQIPTGHAVRPDDVEKTGRAETERNYYYHEGDGDDVFDGVPSNVDPDDGVIDATPLALPDNPVTPPSADPDKINEDGRIAYTQRKGDSNIDNIDKRQFMRFNVSSNTNPVLMEKTNNGVERLIDVSRGGIAVNHNNSLKVGDIVPVHLSYGGLDINADVKVVSATSHRAGAEFVNIDKALANQLLYLNILLEKNNKMLATRF